MTRRPLFVLLLACLAACSQEVPNAPRDPAVAEPAAKPDAVAAGAPEPVTGRSPSASETLDSPELSIVFVEKPACATGEAATVTVKWDVVSLGAQTVSVFVESPANPKKLWVDAGASGEGTTGKWVYDQTRFTIQDRDSGKVLASRLLEKPCTP